MDGLESVDWKEDICDNNTVQNTKRQKLRNVDFYLAIQPNEENEYSNMQLSM